MLEHAEHFLAQARLADQVDQRAKGAGAYDQQGGEVDGNEVDPGGNLGSGYGTDPGKILSWYG